MLEFLRMIRNKTARGYCAVRDVRRPSGRVARLLDNFFNGLAWALGAGVAWLVVGWLALWLLQPLVQ